MKQVAHRLCMGISGLGLFWLLGLISANEFAKSSVLMATCIPGVLGVFLLIPDGCQRTRWLSRSALTIFLLFFLDAAIKGFLRDYFGLRPNPTLVLEAIFNTNKAESNEFIRHNWRDIAEATSAFALVVTLISLYEKKLSRKEASEKPILIKRAGKITTFVFLCSFFALHFNPTMAKENPLLFWPIRYLDYHQQSIEAEEMQRDITAKLPTKASWLVQYTGPPQNTVVWIIGESINRNNMSLYGYARKTTPMLESLGDHLVVFRDVISSAPATMASLMKMLTPADLENPDAWRNTPDMVLIAKEAGYKTFWLSNQFPNDGWLGLVANRADEQLFINKGSGRGENNFDGNLLPGFKAALHDAAARKLIIVHLLGAHPTYEMRYPEGYEWFDAVHDGVSNAMLEAGRSSWVVESRNEYDNAVAYSDFVVANLIKEAMATSGNNASVIYSSDHAQEVGHTRNHTGQSLSDRSGYEIPLLIWTRGESNNKRQFRPELANRPYQTDHLDHTLAGLLKIRSIYYVDSKDLLSDSFVKRARFINGSLYSP